MCTNRIGSVVHELGVTRDLVDISLQVATLDIGRLEAPVERLSCSLVVAHEVQLLDAGVGLGVGWWGLDLLPGCLGAVGVVSADICANQLIDRSPEGALKSNKSASVILQDAPLFVVANSLVSPTRFRETVGSWESMETSEPALLGRRGVGESVILQCRRSLLVDLFEDSLVVFDKFGRGEGRGKEATVAAASLL